MDYYRLDEVCEINPKKTISDTLNDEISFVPMDAVSVDGKIDLKKTISVKYITNYTTFREGDILFAKITPCMENGKGAIATGLKNGYGAGSTEFIVLRPDIEKISQKWLQLFLSQKSFRLYCQQNMTGSAGQKRVPPKFLATCMLPTPTLDMQEQIVTHIEELFSRLDSGVETLKKVKQQLAVYRQAILNEVFSSSDQWTQCNLGDVIETLTDYHANGSYKILKENVILLDEPSYAVMVRSTNFEKGDFKVDLKYIDKHSYDFLKKSQLHGGEVLMGKIGNAGRVYYMRDLGRPMSLAMNMFAMRYKDNIVSKFVYYYLLSPKAAEDIKQYVKGVGTPTIDKKSVRSIKFRYPNMREQNRIVSELESKLSVCDTIEQTVDTALQQAEAMRQSILKQAFEGRL